MELQAYLKAVFSSYIPSPPDTISCSKHDVTLTWEQAGLQFLRGELLYKIERKEKIPPWVVEYSGGKTTKRIENLMTCCPHTFRLRVIVKATAVTRLAELAVRYYGSEHVAWERVMEVFKDSPKEHGNDIDDDGKGDGSLAKNVKHEKTTSNVQSGGDTNITCKSPQPSLAKKPATPWLESQYSKVMTSSTEATGASAVCFCMAVRGGYLKHVQMMLEERPELVEILNNSDGFTPLATAVRIGDIGMIRYLLSMGADVDQRSTTWQTPLHLAVLNANTAIADLLIEKGADFEIRDKNALRVEHYAVDSGDLFTLRHILDRGGDVKVKDSNGWTPLFRAVVEGASTAIVEELVHRGSDIAVIDRAGLSLMAAAKRLTDRHGKFRESVLRLVDSQYPRDKALATFSRVTKKISSVHSLMKH